MDVEEMPDVMNRRGARLRRAAALAALGAALLAAVACGLTAPPRKYDPEKLPYEATWGPYTVVVEKTGTDDFAPQRLQVRDAHGASLREVRDQRVMAVAFEEFTGSGSPELHVTTLSGGAHCCGKDYVFTHEGGLRNLLIFDGDNGGINAIKDLNGDGRPEILASSDALAYFGDLCYACSPTLKMVIGWDGRRYADQTRRFPADARALAQEYRRDFLKTRHQKGDTAEEMRRMNAAGYYGNALMVGDGPAARRWLLANAPAATRGWLLAHEVDLRRAVSAGAGRIRVSQAKVLPVDDRATER